MFNKAVIGIGGIIVVVIVIVLVLAAMKPDDFRATRSVTINAPAGDVYGYLVDFNQWKRWSPHEKLNPGMKRQFKEVPTGIGSTYSWEGDGQAGEGSMEIIEAKSPDHLAIKYDASAPATINDVMTFDLEPADTNSLRPATKVTWTMTGAMTFSDKVMEVIAHRHSAVVGEFDTGLQNLKSLAEVS